MGTGWRCGRRLETWAQAGDMGAGWRCGRRAPAGSGSGEAFSLACRLQPVGWAQLADGESQQHSAVS